MALIREEVGFGSLAPCIIAAPSAQASSKKSLDRIRSFLSGAVPDDWEGYVQVYVCKCDKPSRVPPSLQTPVQLSRLSLGWLCGKRPSHQDFGCITTSRTPAGFPFHVLHCPASAHARPE